MNATTTRYRIVIRDLATNTDRIDETDGATYNLRNGERMCEMRNTAERRQIAWRHDGGDTWYAGYEYRLQEI